MLFMDPEGRLQDQSIKLYQAGMSHTQYVTERPSTFAYAQAPL